MTTIVTRAGKGSPLTNAEMDSNFTNLNTDKAELTGAVFTGPVSATTGTFSGAVSGTAGTFTTGTFTGVVTVPAGATGTQVPQAQEVIAKVAGAARIPTWTTAGRPVSPTAGDSGFNTDLGYLEWWNGAVWRGSSGRSSTTTITGVLDVTGIPAWARSIRAVATGISMNGAGHPLFQFGSGTSGVKAAGYVRSNTWLSAPSVVAASAGLIVYSAVAANGVDVIIDAHSNDGLVWTAAATVGYEGAFLGTSSASFTLPETLDRMRFTAVSGAPDVGTVFLTWS